MVSETFTYKTLAHLFRAIDHSQLPGGRQDLLGVTRYEPFQTMYRHLEQLAEQAGTPRCWNGWELEAVNLHETFDLLLATENWHEAGIFDPDDEGTLCFVPLLSICRARKQNSQGDPARLLEVEQKLIAAATRQRQLKEREKQLDLEIGAALLRLLGEGAEHRTSSYLVELLEKLTGYLRRLPPIKPEGEAPQPAADHERA